MRGGDGARAGSAAQVLVASASWQREWLRIRLLAGEVPHQLLAAPVHVFRTASESWVVVGGRCSSGVGRRRSGAVGRGTTFSSDSLRPMWWVALRPLRCASVHPLSYVGPRVRARRGTRHRPCGSHDHHGRAAPASLGGVPPPWPPPGVHIQMLANVLTGFGRVGLKLPSGAPRRVIRRPSTSSAKSGSRVRPRPP